jgi:hypothetical protein
LKDTSSQITSCQSRAGSEYSRSRESERVDGMENALSTAGKLVFLIRAVGPCCDEQKQPVGGVAQPCLGECRAASIADMARPPARTRVLLRRHCTALGDFYTRVWSSRCMDAARCESLNRTRKRTVVEYPPPVITVGFRCSSFGCASTTTKPNNSHHFCASAPRRGNPRRSNKCDTIGLVRSRTTRDLDIPNGSLPHLLPNPVVVRCAINCSINILGSIRA